jgi:preprotein translocase subunit SecD
MIYIARWKAYLIIAICLLGVIFSLPNLLTDQQLSYMPSWLRSTINLGLELRGGSHLQLEVDMKTVLKDQTANLIDDVRSTLRKEKAGYTGLVSTADKKGATFILRDPNQQESIKKALNSQLSGVDIIFEADGRVNIKLTEKTIKDRQRAAVDQSIEVVRRRIDETGTKEPLIQRQGDDRIIVQLPGLDDPAEVKRLIGRTAKLNFHLVDHEAGHIEVGPSGTPVSSVPPGTMILPETTREGQTIYLPIKKQVSISGDQLVDAHITNENGQPAVAIAFNSSGARKFAEISANNLKRRFAIVLDNKIISAPVFQSVIPNGKAVISGHFTTREALDLALLLRAGALPAPLNVIEERTVGPSLGADSIKDGQTATIFAFILVAIFMLLNYSLFGIFADIALAFNMILLFAALSLLQATLTLPGIAAIALTMGMAVDANVLIYERIKEELRHGLKPASAIETGYKRALTTIIDSNLTTLIGAAVLLEFGTGPIRGFAINLALGIIISLFSAISLTRLMVITWLRRKTNVTTLPL